MSELICKCGHLMSEHGRYGCMHPASEHTNLKYCDCDVEVQPMTKEQKQRAAAIAHLRALGKSVKFWLAKFQESPLNRSYLAAFHTAVEHVNVSIDAYRAIGVLPTKERKP